MSEKKEPNKIPTYADPALIEKDNESPVPSIPTKRDYLTIFQEKLDKIIDAINAKEAQFAHHMDRIATALETIAESTGSLAISVPSTSAPTSAPTPKPTPKPIPTSYLTKIKDLFPIDLQEMLTFEDKGDWIRIAPRRFLGSENFAKIASIIRNAGGEYVSAGKNSHFKVTKQ